MNPTSSHAHLRSAQRGVRPQHIDLALAWGMPIRQDAGRVAWHLGHNEAREARRQGVQIPERAINVAVVVARDGTLVTVIRSPHRHRLCTYGGRRRPQRRRGGQW